MNYKEIQSHAIACSVLGRDPNALPDVSMRPEHQRDAIISDIMLMDIADAINKLDGDFKANYNDPTQEKWFAVFDASKGFGFSHSAYDSWHADPGVGSRLCFRFRSEEASDFFGQQFNDLHKKCLNN